MSNELEMRFIESVAECLGLDKHCFTVFPIGSALQMILTQGDFRIGYLISPLEISLAREPLNELTRVLHWMSSEINKKFLEERKNVNR